MSPADLLREIKLCVKRKKLPEKCAYELFTCLAGDIDKALFNMAKIFKTYKVKTPVLKREIIILYGGFLNINAVYNYDTNKPIITED